MATTANAGAIPIPLMFMWILSLKIIYNFSKVNYNTSKVDYYIELMPSVVHAWVILMLSCMVWLSQVSQNCNIYRMWLPCLMVQRNLTTSLLCWSHYTNSLWRRESITTCCFLYIMPCMIRLQKIWEICSRRELMFEHCTPQPSDS